MTYVLDGVMHHKGESRDGGHYVAFARTGSQWRKYDDSHAHDVDKAEVLTEEAIMLSYTRKPLGWMNKA